jgi:outer membrane biosynthesis protein TonB
MLDVLMESNAARTRKIGGTVTSTLIHAAIVAGAITLTVRPNEGDAHTPPEERVITYIGIDRRPKPPAPPTSRLQPERRSMPTTPTTLPLPVVDHIPTELPSIDPSVPTITEPTTSFGPRISTTGSPGEPLGPGGPPDAVLEERYVDRSPRLLGSPVPPIFPFALRERGRSGRVVIQFVVDTLGRAETTGLEVVEATDPLFAEAVRSVLPRYRFSSGEVAGRKVRTLVQLPFDFTVR